MACMQAFIKGVQAQVELADQHVIDQEQAHDAAIAELRSQAEAAQQSESRAAERALADAKVSVQS